MTDDPLDPSMREISWRRKLTPGEQARLGAWLEEHPEAQGDWEADAALNEALDLLPEAPVSSNFTARVLRSVEMEKRPVGSRGFWKAALGAAFGGGHLGWLRPAACGGVVLLSVVMGYRHVQDNHRKAERQEIARSLATLSSVSTLPKVEVLENFDAIQALSRTPAADEQLLQALQ